VGSSHDCTVWRFRGTECGEWRREDVAGAAAASAEKLGLVLNSCFCLWRCELSFRGLSGAIDIVRELIYIRAEM